MYEVRDFNYLIFFDNVLPPNSEDHLPPVLKERGLELNFFVLLLAHNKISTVIFVRMLLSCSQRYQ